MKNNSQSIVTGVVIGAGAWLAYAAVEFFLYSAAPLLLQPEAELNAPVWRIAAIAAGFYIVAGAVLGGMTSAALIAFGNAGSGRMVRSLVTLQFLAIFSVNLVADGKLPGAEQISLAAAAIAILAGLASLLSERWYVRAGFLQDPLTASLLVMTPPWIGSLVFADQSGPFRLGMILPALLGVALASWLFHKRPRPLWTTPHRYAAAMAGFLAMSGGAGWALSAGPSNLPPRPSAASVNRPNVVLIVMDTVRADHTSLYGYERDTTPFLRELARESTVYKNAIAVSDMTLPTHASMFTGLYPQTHGAHFAPPSSPLGRPLAETSTTMAEILRANGYRTMAVVANSAYVSPQMGLRQGFEAFDWRAPVAVDNSASPYPHLRKRMAHLLPSIMADVELITRRAREITGEAQRLLDQAGAGPAPYFLFVNFMDAHSPYFPPEPFRAAYGCSDASLEQRDHTLQLDLEVIARKRVLTGGEQHCLESHYDGGIQYMDAQLRGLVASLKARGRFENTLVIVTSDHGEAFGKRNHMGHGGISVYQEEIGIPLLVKYPGLHSPGEVEARVSQIDVLPTVLQAANLAPMRELAGVSLLQIPSGDARGLVSISYPLAFFGALNPDFRRIEEALTFGHMKLVVSTLGKRELYDLSADLMEEKNLYRDRDSDARALMTMFSQLKRNVPAAEDRDKPTGSLRNMDRLRSLGYVQ